MVRCFKALQRHVPDARWLIVNRGDHALIRGALARHSVRPAQDRDCSRRPPPKCPRSSGGCTPAWRSYDPLTPRSPARRPSSAEYLGCGVPCLGNAGVGDVQAILDGRDVGIVLHASTIRPWPPRSSSLSTLPLEPGIAERCREAALDLFSLDKGVARLSFGLSRSGRLEAPALDVGPQLALPPHPLDVGKQPPGTNEAGQLIVRDICESAVTHRPDHDVGRFGPPG